MHLVPEEVTREHQIPVPGGPEEPWAGAGSSVSTVLLLTTEPSAQPSPPPGSYLFDSMLSLAHVTFAHLLLGFISDEVNAWHGYTTFLAVFPSIN